MKKIFLIFFAIFLFKIDANADMRGHEWLTSDDDIVKIILVNGYLRGFEAGIYFGRIEGFGGVYNNVKNKIDKKTDEELRNQGFGLANKKYMVFDNDVRSYAMELDSFLIAYPACRMKEMNFVITRLLLYWYGDKKVTYSSIAKDCDEIR